MWLPWLTHTHTRTHARTHARTHKKQIKAKQSFVQTKVFGALVLNETQFGCQKFS